MQDTRLEPLDTIVLSTIGLREMEISIQLNQKYLKKIKNKKGFFV